MNTKLLKKLKDKEEKLMDAIYELKELLDTTEDEELCAMADDFEETLLDFIYSNDKLNLNDIRTFIEEME